MLYKKIPQVAGFFMFNYDYCFYAANISTDLTSDIGML